MPQPSRKSQGKRARSIVDQAHELAAQVSTLVHEAYVEICDRSLPVLKPAANGAVPASTASASSSMVLARSTAGSSSAVAPCLSLNTLTQFSAAYLADKFKEAFQIMVNLKNSVTALVEASNLKGMLSFSCL